MPAAPARRPLRTTLAAGLGATLLLAGCSAPPPGTYLQPGKTAAVVRAIMHTAGSDKLLGARLGTVDASATVVKDGRSETWTLREGSDEARRTQVAALDGAHPSRAVDEVDWDAATRALQGSDIARGCTPRGVRLSIDLQLGRPLTDMMCLDNSRHQWLGPEGRPYEVLDLRSPEGMTAALDEIREVVQSSRVTHVALVNDNDNRLDVEVAGSCGDLVGCPAIRASRMAKPSDLPVVVASALPARLNYAQPFDLGVLDPAALQPVMRKVLTEHRYSWWDSFTVTIYQTGPAGPILEFKVGHDVFWTDLQGVPTTR